MKIFFFLFGTALFFFCCQSVPKISSSTSRTQWETAVRPQAPAGTPGQTEFVEGFFGVLDTVEKFFQRLSYYGAGTTGEAKKIRSDGLPWQEVEAHPVRYEDIIAILSNLRDGLSRSAGVLEMGGRGDWKVRVYTALLRLDFNGNGKLEDEESLGSLFFWSRQAALDNQAAREFYLAHDAGDSLWLAGYCHLIEGALDLVLAYDFRHLWSSYAGFVFPKVADQGTPTKNKDFEIHPIDGSDSGEKARLAFLKAARLSPESWKLILAEKRDDHEWLPNPHQSSVLPLRVTDQKIRGWLQFMKDWETLLDGEKLYPLEKGYGFDLVKFFRRLPEVEDWETSRKQYVEKTSPNRLLATPFDLDSFFSGDDGLFYALWFN